MIVAVRCNMPSFSEVTFTTGLNVVLADRTKESTRRDSRNGLGKTTLIEIIHFCLGSNARKNQGVMVSQLMGWRFTLEIRLGDRQLFITRSTGKPNLVEVAGDVGDISIASQRRNGVFTLRVTDWNTILGELWFGLSNQDSLPKYHPSFRSLFSYFARRRRDSFASPFIHHRAQKEWDRQVNNAFLLGLRWEHAAQLQELKDEENVLRSLQRAAREGLLEGVIGSLGNLEAERTRLESEVRWQSESLRNFRVHSQYREIEHEANELTSTIQRLANANLADRRLADLYRGSIQDDEIPNDPDTQEVFDIYQAVGLAMPALVRHRLDEVETFHRQILDNRRDYLQSEIQRIESQMSQRQIEIDRSINRRAQLLEVLETHGALQEFTQLQELHLEVVARLEEVQNRITNLRRFEQGKSEVRVKKELLLQTARRDFEERRNAREGAIRRFNSNSEALYSAPGNLLVDISDTGLKFDVEILRSGSQGIDNMKIFCYDLMLAQLWANKRPFAGLLIHDSTIFDGVDERQKSQALELAQRESERCGFQYICALNSDALPTKELSSEFDLNKFVRLRLTDESEEGGLLGIRY